MSLSENPHETKPLDEEATARLQLLANGLTHQYGGPDGKGGTDVLSADVRAALTALAKAQRENTRLADLGARSYVKYSDAANALAAAQLNARALREALDRAHLCATFDPATRTCGGCFVSAALSTPADEAALREIVTRVALYTLLNAHHDGAEIEHQTQACLAPLVERANAIVDRILGAPETHAKEG